MSTKYVYLRNPSSVSKTKDNKPTKGMRAGCVAFSVEDNTIKYAFSYCSPRDKFDNDIAKKIADARLAKQPTIIALDDDKKELLKNIHSITRLVMEDIKAANKNKKPIHDKDQSRSFRAMLAAHGWLKRSDKYFDTQKKQGIATTESQENIV